MRSFLISNASFWLDRYHIDGLRVDAVASMLYLDYGRKGGEWIPNQYGGNENIDAIEFLRLFNQGMYREHPDTQTIAEESTSWPSVSRPTYTGGLGFGMKWDMGWMHDTLSYFNEDPIGRRYHHHKLTFRSMYFWSENYVLPLSHDEVVHGKGSLIGKMHGDEWQRFANLRLLFAYMWAQPGKKLMFQGGEIGQQSEWAHDRSVDWHLLGESPLHVQLMTFVSELNRLYRAEPALHVTTSAWAASSGSTPTTTTTACSCSCARGTPPATSSSRCSTARRCHATTTASACRRSTAGEEILNSDAEPFGGSGMGNLGGVTAEAVTWHGRTGVGAPDAAAAVRRVPATRRVSRGGCSASTAGAGSRGTARPASRAGRTRRTTPCTSARPARRPVR